MARALKLVILLAVFVLSCADISAATGYPDTTPTSQTENGQTPAQLAETSLYKDKARNCHFVDLSTWEHPTKKVLAKHMVPLSSLELCNENKYPIFHVKFKYDPQGSTDSFFHPFYADMFLANGSNPMAFIDSTDNEIVYIDKVSSSRLDIGYEPYEP